MELQWDEDRQELSYLIDQDEGDISVALKMIEHNQITGLLPLHRQYIDEQIQLIYEVKGHHTLQGILEKRPVSVMWACRVLGLVLDVLLAGDAYFLDMREYCLTPEFIYFSHEEHQVFLCYLPGRKRDISQDFRSLMETVMEHLDHRKKQEIEWFYGLYDMYCAEEITFAELREHLERCGRNREPELRNTPDIQYGRGVLEAGIGNGIEQADGKEKVSFCLKRHEHHRFWRKKQETASILPDEFILCEGKYAVGRRQDQEVLLLPQQISREHALLEVEQNQVYLTDRGSANGTYINDRKISAHVKTRLETGDVITFADISYYFLRCPVPSC